MTPLEEARDLALNPLPKQITVRDEILPTIIFALDEKILSLEGQLDALRKQRQESLSRAIEMRIMSDLNYIIETKEIYGNRIVNPELLQSRYPDKFEMYVKIRKDQLKTDSESKFARDIGEVLTKINLGLADKIFGKANVTACSANSVSFEYFARKRDGMMIE